MTMISGAWFSVLWTGVISVAGWASLYILALEPHLADFEHGPLLTVGAIVLAAASFILSLLFCLCVMVAIWGDGESLFD